MNDAVTLRSSPVPTSWSSLILPLLIHPSPHTPPALKSNACPQHESTNPGGREVCNSGQTNTGHEKPRAPMKTCHLQKGRKCTQSKHCPCMGEGGHKEPRKYYALVPSKALGTKCNWHTKVGHLLLKKDKNNQAIFLKEWLVLSPGTKVPFQTACSWGGRLHSTSQQGFAAPSDTASAPGQTPSSTEQRCIHVSSPFGLTPCQESMSPVIT